MSGAHIDHIWQPVTIHLRNMGEPWRGYVRRVTISGEGWGTLTLIDEAQFERMRVDMETAVANAESSRQSKTLHASTGGTQERITINADDQNERQTR